MGEMTHVDCGRCSESKSLHRLRPLSAACLSVSISLSQHLGLFGAMAPPIAPAVAQLQQAAPTS